MKLPRRVFAISSVSAISFIPLPEMQCDGGNSSPTCDGGILDKRYNPNIGTVICNGASGWVQAEALCYSPNFGHTIVTGSEIWHPGGGDLNGGWTAASAKCNFFYPDIQDVWG